MDENLSTNRSETRNTTCGLSASRSRISTARLVAGVIGALVLAVGAYSIHVAVHKPDAQETILLGQTKLAAGSPASLRILVRNRFSGKPVKGAEVVLSLRSKATTLNLGTFHTDATGTLGESLAIPDIPPGQYELVIKSRSWLGKDHITRNVEIQHPARVLLSSDKPIYQPGQTIHLRSLTLNGRTQKPFAGEAVTFEVKDPKGNKVFKETCATSKFGIASADFVLASELNLGRYEISATARGGDSLVPFQSVEAGTRLSPPLAAERTVEVKRYVLPKFKINIATDRSYYQPGQTVSGSVQANYFFGRPVGASTVKLSAATLQEKPVTIIELEGRTDESGKYAFQFRLPEMFVGMPQKNEQAFLDLKAELRDTAGHVEEATMSLSVARRDLEITVIPEAGAIVQGIENMFYVLTAYPDGRPAPCRVSLHGNAVQSDEQGVSEITLGPSETHQQLYIQAIDPAGRNATVTYSPDTERPAPTFLLRTDKAVYQAGQNAQITILSPEKQNTVFIDVIKDGQTMLTRSVPLEDHKGTYSLALPASLVGALRLNAYLITQNGEDRGCSRLIYINPASGLRVAGTLSKPVFRPGEVAKIEFAVTDAEGRPAPAALGIAAVDESVFGLSENRPGLLQQFLDAEGELLKPRYQIKSFECPGQFLTWDEKNQRLAQAYLASFDQQPVGPSLDDLVSNGDIPKRLIEHAREMRGTPAYEKYRKDPQYADAMRLLEDERGTYSLREATGPAKLLSAENHRKAYFTSLKEYLGIGAVAALFLSPIFLLFYNARPGAGIHPDALAQTQTERYVQAAASTYNLLSLLVFLPLVYPFGFLVLGHRAGEMTGLILIGFEAVVVVSTLIMQLLRLTRVQGENLQPEIASLRAFTGAFLFQFLISRAGIAWLCSHPRDEGFAALWFLGSAISALVVLGALGSHVRRQLMAKDILPQPVGSRVIEVLVVLSIMAILAAMLLPALAKAKARAQSVSLLNDLKQLEMANRTAEQESKPNTQLSGTPRVRRDFPETLLWRPELITDDQGRASLEIPLADSITTWRASVDGISAAGKMGSVQVPIPVFQDFFVDLDLPVSMTLQDQVSVPLTCYNYLKASQDVRITVASANWFESPTQNLSLHLQPDEVKSVSLPIKVLRIGNHSLRVTAQGANVADAIEREIRVLPTGQCIEHTQNGVLKENWTDTFAIAPERIPDSQNLWVKFYPSRFTEIVEGLDSIFQAPYGCFEQTSSTTYPNVLVLDYMKRMGRLTPEIEVRARKFINAGYQRLLTFEVVGGGFEWFGRPPANICLTAYGILEFTDMARGHPVDEAVTERARKWLFARQNRDGSWDEIHRGWTWAGRGSMTAFVAWALAESGDQSANLDRALSYLRAHPEELSSTYAKALAANAFLARDSRDADGRQLASQLKDAAVADREQCLHWTSAGFSVTWSRGEGMDVETTALSAMALIKAGIWPQSVKQALTWLSNEKSSSGNWGSTQATILAMRALLAASTASLGQDFDSALTLILNGQTVETFHLNKQNSDVMKQLNLTRYLRTGANRIEFRQNPAGELPFQLTGAYWVPANHNPVAEPASSEPLQISIHYDRTTLPVNDQLNCAVTVSNHTDQVINMAIVDLGIPPGFDVDTTAFEILRQQERIAKFELTGNQVILYLREIANLAPFQFEYSLRAKYPLRVQTTPSAVYEYYQPKNRSQSKPLILQVLRN
ncbi:MAG: hypothetical protein C5B50_07525 [Verrucomicrobia bacterium]|nr:MAG: hypothetical protein C5B50_07525 [Verrucomicrobiota bacterium]